jgi:hypothetical protein
VNPIITIAVFQVAVWQSGVIVKKKTLSSHPENHAAAVWLYKALITMQFAQPLDLDLVCPEKSPSWMRADAAGTRF